MALISKIRDKSGWAIGFIALSLILFLVGSDLAGSKGIFGGNDQSVGEIAGNTIMVQDYQQRVEQERANYESQYGRSVSDEQLQGVREQAWNTFVQEFAYEKEYEALGLKVSDDELTDMVQGNHIHPMVQQSFTNPQTRMFDKMQLLQFLKNFNTLQPEQKQAWVNLETQLRQTRLAEKYQGLLALSNYATTEEAKREYQGQMAKADVRYLYVPFFTIADSTIKVEDSQLESYLSKHKDQYKGENARTLQYAAFPVIPSKADSATFYGQIKQLARDLATAPNDSAFARMNSDIPSTSTYLGLSDMNDQLKEAVKTFNAGGIYGPYRDGNIYSIYKYGGSKKDSLFTVRASHILIRANGTSDTAKADAKRRAEAVLARIKGGASFEAVAATEGTDGTAQKGGDLGYFKNNHSMVKKFEDAVFGFSGTGLLPNIVETDFGYHIIKITDPKSNTLYRVAAISKELRPSEATHDEAFRKADQFALENKTFDDVKANAKKLNIPLLTANRIQESASTINNMKNAREAVRWAFEDDTKIGQVSKAFETENMYIVAVVTAKSDKDKVKVDDYRDELTARVRAEKKGEQLLEKVKGLSGTLEQMAQKYGAGALVESATGISMNGGSLISPGADPTALGKALSLKPGSKSKPFVGENGVFVMECLNNIAAPEMKDYSQFKNGIASSFAQRVGYGINQAIKDNAKIVDKRAKFY
jgi:peptidyl-prolyl cis-trans isomerase D